MQITLTPFSILELAQFGRPLELGPTRRNSITFGVTAGVHDRIELETGELFSRFAPDDKEPDAEFHLIEMDEGPADRENIMHYWESRKADDLLSSRRSSLSFHVGAEKAQFERIGTRLAAGILPSEITIHIDSKGGDEHVALSYVGGSDMLRWKNRAHPSVPIAGATFSFGILKKPDKGDTQAETGHDVVPASMRQILATLVRIEELLKPVRIALLVIAGGAIVAAFRFWN